MKILYCLAGTFNSGGMERIVIRKANWLVQHGYEVYIVTTDQKGRHNFFEINSGIRTIDLEINYCDNNNSGFIKKIFSRHFKIKKHKKRLTNLVKEIDPDIIVSTYGNEVEFLHLMQCRAKKIVEIHFAKLFRLQSSQSLLYRLSNGYLTLRDEKIIKEYDAFVTLTKEDAEQWGKIPNIHIIPNFIDKRADKPAQLEQNRAIAIGRLSFQKGYDRMIRTWALVRKQHPDWILEIYGSNNGVDLKQLISEYDLNKSCIIHSPVSNIDDKIQKSSMLLLTSHYEGLPMVFLEAMSNGLPIISMECKCGPKDIIKEGKTGFIVPNGDISMMSDRICTLIEDLSLRKLMGKNAYEKSVDYTIEKIMPRWVDLFNELINPKSKD